MNTSAGGPLAGFIFQVDLGLLRLFELEIGEALTLERSDDLAILSTDGKVSIEVQVKHSLQSRASLTLHSPSFWKTIGIWSRKAHGEEYYILPQLQLYSNSALSKDLAHLETRLVDRDDTVLADLQERLNGVAERRGNKSLRRYYREWRELDSSRKKTLLRHTSVIAGAPTLSNLQNDVSNAIRRTGVHISQIEIFRRNLDSWYLSLVRQRISSSGMEIEAEEFHDQMAYLHRTSSTITIHFEGTKEEIPDMIEEVEKNKLYQRQLSLVGASSQSKLDAYEFYLRSKVERQRLLENSLVAREELTLHEEDLVDGWRVVRSEELERGQRAADRQGKDIYFRCAKSDSNIVNNRVPRFLHVGTLHLLADGPGNPRIGWHPNFEDLLRQSASDE